MIGTDAQVRKLMEELKKHGTLGLAAARAGLDRKTAAKYRDVGQLPSELKAPRNWRTREDPFEEVWPVIQSKLELTRSRGAHRASLQSRCFGELSCTS